MIYTVTRWVVPDPNDPKKVRYVSPRTPGAVKRTEKSGVYFIVWKENGRHDPGHQVLDVMPLRRDQGVRVGLLLPVPAHADVPPPVAARVDRIGVRYVVDRERAVEQPVQLGPAAGGHADRRVGQLCPTAPLAGLVRLGVVNVGPQAPDHADLAGHVRTPRRSSTAGRRRRTRCSGTPWRGGRGPPRRRGGTRTRWAGRAGGTPALSLWRARGEQDRAGTDPAGDQAAGVLNGVLHAPAAPPQAGRAGNADRGTAPVTQDTATAVRNTRSGDVAGAVHGLRDLPLSAVAGRWMP